jgi:hypothetical protein
MLALDVLFMHGIIISDFGSSQEGAANLNSWL